MMLSSHSIRSTTPSSATPAQHPWTLRLFSCTLPAALFLLHSSCCTLPTQHPWMLGPDVEDLQLHSSLLHSPLLHSSHTASMNVETLLLHSPCYTLPATIFPHSIHGYCGSSATTFLGTLFLAAFLLVTSILSLKLLHSSLLHSPHTASMNILMSSQKRYVRARLVNVRQPDMALTG